MVNIVKKKSIILLATFRRVAIVRNDTLATRKVAHDKNNEDVKGRLVIPYDRGTSERIRRIATKCGIRRPTAFHSRNTLGKVLCNTAPNLPKFESKYVMYSPRVNVAYGISA